MPIYTAIDFTALHQTSFTLQQQQWVGTFRKPLARKHIAEWRAFRDNSIVSYKAASSTSSSTSPPPALASSSSSPSPFLAGIVGDPKTYSQAAKATRVFLDEDFHTFKMLRDEDFALLDWLRLFRADCLIELKRFLSITSATEIQTKLKSINKDLSILYEKRAALESEIMNLELSLNALQEVKLGVNGR